MRVRLFCILFLLAVIPIAAHAGIASLPRVIVSTDIGGTDPDDNQSMAHLMMYTDRIQLEGIISSPSYGKGSKAEILRMIGLFRKDWPTLKKHYKLMSPDALRKISKQGRRGEAPLCGYAEPTEGSEWIVRCARRKDSRPLWVLVWGALEDVAQALHDAPDIASKLRIYWIGGPNKKWGCNAYNYIVCNFPDLWFIECNSSYRGFIGSNKEQTEYQALYWQTYMKDCGTLGNDFVHYYQGIVKMGDTPSLLYLIGKDASGQPFDIDDPASPHWGGQFEKMTVSPKFIVDGSLTAKDTVPVYGIMEWHLKGPVVDVPEDSVCFTLLVDKQTWRGHYIGHGEYVVRYAPKAPTTLHYVISSPIAGFPQHEGDFVAAEEWQNHITGSSSHLRDASIPLGNAWWTDISDASLRSGQSDYEDYRAQSGQWEGAATVARWRTAVLKDWSERFSVLKLR